MALMSAAEYAALESSKKAEKAGLANQAAQKAATPSVPSSNNYASALYNARNNTSMSQPGASSSNAKSKVSYSAPSLGSLYKNVAGTDWQSTNPDNPNAAKYYADGSPVASVNFDYSKTGGQKFDGYASPDQFKQIMDMNNSGALNTQGGQQSLASLLQGWANSGQLTSNDSIYKNGLASDPRPSLSSVYAPPPPSQSGTMTSTAGYVKNPTVDAMPLQQQLDYYKQHPEEAKQEVLRAKTVYDQKSGSGDAAGANSAHSWADMLRQAAGISDSNAQYGNNNGVDAETQRKYTDTLLNARQTDQINGSAGGTTGTDTGTGTGTGKPQSATDLIRSIYDSNYSSQSQRLKSARDLQLAGLAGQEGIINQNTTNNLNSNDVMANQRMQALKEAMANAGLSASGDNISAQVGLGNSQQQSATDINNNKTNQLANLLAQRNAINNNASADDLALLQQLQAQRDGLLLNQSNADRTFNYNAGQDTIKNDRQAKIDNWNAYMDSVGLTGNLGTGAKADWGLLGGTDGAMTQDAKTKYLQQEGVKINNELSALQLADYPQEQKLKIQQLQKQIAQIGAAPYQSAQDIEYDKIKLDTAKEQLNQLVNGKPTTSKPKTAEEFAKYIDSTPGVVTKDFSGKENVNKTAVETMIVTSDLSELEMFKLYQRYGLKWEGPVPTGK